MPSTLLLADDSVTIQRVIELTFADEDIRVVAVSDGDQAIEALGKNPPDIVLADVGMPGRDGYQVAEHIKHTPALSHIPVLLLTGAFEPIDQARAARAGCDGVLAKPFEPQLVIGRVKELLAKPKSVATALDAPSSPPPAAAAPWTPAVDDPAGPAPVNPPSAPEEVDRYFDRLDRAFANLSSGNLDEPPPPKPPASEVDWFSTTAPSEPATARPAVDRWDAQESRKGEASDAAPASPLHVAPLPPPPAPRPQLADAFAALLAAEQAVPVPAAAAWTPLAGRAAPLVPQEPEISDDVIEEIVRRVLARMSDHVVRETVANIASETAERLVKEEIERIKSAARP